MFVVKFTENWLKSAGKKSVKFTNEFILAMWGIRPEES